ncbi:MAG: nitrous oxide-stimulated promoter family protein [Clostridia bacterium]|nr:nitrous oxide-stimulated promoter family protein [Clostridia bacterium]
MQKDKDVEVVNLMIRLYCRKKHKSKNRLCDECAQLAEYAKARRENCPFGDQKSFCSNCKIHCYKPSMREQISQVMRFSGPRIMFYHPVVACKHISETMKFKRNAKKEKKKSKRIDKKGD